MVTVPVPHHELPARDLRPRDRYRLMTDLVAPRPIAWVSSKPHSGPTNLAPFSYYQAVSSDPPTIVLGIASRPDGRPKDTLANILATREFTISHVGRPLVEACNHTAGDYPAEESEWSHAGPGGIPLPSAPAQRVAAPRVAAAKASLECRLLHAIPLHRDGRPHPATTLVVAQIVCLTVARDLLQRSENGQVAPIPAARLASVGRLGGIAYTDGSEVFELPRPQVSARTRG
jgi:flavin reductase (DIM6/NTAB) family NADH-FMN oxidoreductase RutF